MHIHTVSDAARRFCVRREDVIAVAEDNEVGRKLGTTFVFTRDDLEDLEDALIEKGLLEPDPDEDPDAEEEEEPGDEEGDGDEE